MTQQSRRTRLVTKHQPSAVTAILGVHDFFGELCLAGYPLRIHSRGANRQFHTHHQEQLLCRSAKNLRCMEKENKCDRLSTWLMGPQDGHGTPTKSDPTPAVNAIASAPQNVTRTAPIITPAPPARAP
jgi:hypothetical protein